MCLSFRLRKTETCWCSFEDFIASGLASLRILDKVFHYCRRAVLVSSVLVCSALDRTRWWAGPRKAVKKDLERIARIATGAAREGEYSRHAQVELVCHLSCERSFCSSTLNEPTTWQICLATTLKSQYSDYIHLLSIPTGVELGPQNSDLCGSP